MGKYSNNGGKMKIYCVVSDGQSIDEEIAELLFRSAQGILKRKDKKSKLSHKPMGLTGEVKTENKIGNMGPVFGIIFNAEFDWQGGSTKIEFLTKPVMEDENKKVKWFKVPLFPCNPSLDRN